MEALTFLFYPFLGCVLLILIHAYFGIHILERGIIFVDLAMAQFIAIGIAISFLVGHEETGRNLYAALFAILGASVLTLARNIRKNVNLEAFIGVLYIFSLAASMFGITLSFKYDLPTAPLIVASLSIAFFLLLIWRTFLKGLQGKRGYPF